MLNYQTAPKNQSSSDAPVGFAVNKLPAPLAESPYFSTAIGQEQLSQKERDALAFYREHGYLIIEEPVIDEATAKSIVSHAQGVMPAGENRLQDAWRTSEDVRNLACNETILGTLRLLYGREPIPFQTLNFLRGTEQRTHSDAIHFSSLPARFMCGVWTALEDITINQGPLHYYPGSHTLPEFDYYDLGINEELLYPDSPHAGEPDWNNPRTMAKYKLYEELIERLMAERGFEKQALTLKRGQTLIWASNLCHGGNKVLDRESTRYSQVTHYHFDGVIPFTPMFSNAKMGEYYLPSLVNVRTGESVARSYNFSPVELEPLNRNNLYRIRLQSSEISVSKRGYYEELARLNAELEYHKNESERLRSLRTSALSRVLNAFKKFGRQGRS